MSATELRPFLTRSTPVAAPVPLILAAILSFALFLAIGQPLSAAQEIRSADVTRKLQEAKTGAISVDELSQFILDGAIANPSIIDYLGGMTLDLPGFREVLGSMTLRRARRIFTSGDVSVLETLSQLAAALLPEKNPEREQISLLFENARDIEALVRHKKIEELLILYEKPKLPGLQELLDTRTEGAIVSLARTLIKEQEPLAGLKTLARIDASLDNVELQSLAQKLITDIADAMSTGTFNYQSWTLNEPAVQSFLAKLTPQVRDQVLEIYRWKSLELLARGNAEEAGLYYNLIIGNRPDPNVKNDELRRELLFAAKGPATREFAAGRMEELRAAGLLTVGDRIRLLFRGYYGFGVLIFFMLSLLLVFGSILFLALRPQVLRSGLEQVSVLVEEKKEEKAERSRDRRGVGYHRLTDTTDEYSRLLEIFGLEDGATENEIKRAFRDAVKRYHPDSQGSTGVAVDDEGKVDETFQELRRAYERILEIRGAWFGRRK